MSLSVAKKHICWDYTKDVNEICAEFFKKFNFNYFDYARFYPNGEVVFLFSDPDWVKQFFNTPDYIPPCNILLPGAHLWDAYIPESFLAIATQEFKHSRGLTLLFRSIDFIEVLNFAAPMENKQALDLYLNNRGFLEQFGHYFINKAADMIETIEKKPLHIQYEISWDSKKSEIIPDTPNFFPKHKKNSLCLNAGLSKILSMTTHLTRREIECLSFITEGYSAKRIAQQLNISPRTVEKHIDAIKEKINCRTQYELLSFLHRPK